MATVVDYSIYLEHASGGEEKKSFSTNKQVELLRLAAGITKGYLWQRDRFCLRQQNCSVLGLDDYISFHGEVDCGDNIEDEWFLVYTLFQMSLADEGLLISIEDDDGEFLLVEAADELPSWLNPDVAENRVFIHKGKLHIIPIPSNPSEVTIFPVEAPSLSHALKLIKGIHNTIASDLIQNSILARIQKFSDRMNWNMHRAFCNVPLDLAHVLFRKPAVLNRIVDELEALPTISDEIFQKAQNLLQNKRKDLVNSRILGNPRYEEHGETLVMKVLTLDCLIRIEEGANYVKRRLQSDLKSHVCFTKFSYSKLLSLNIPVPAFWMNKSVENSKSQHSQHLGFKLALGFELLSWKLKSNENSCQMLKEIDQKMQKHIDLMRNIECTEVIFKTKAEERNCWEGLKEHLLEYLYFSLLDKKEFLTWENSNFLDVTDNGISDTNLNFENLPEDDDSWLTLSEDEVDLLLKRRFQHVHDLEEQNIETIVENTRNFVNTFSDYEGIETEMDEIDVNPSSIVEEVQLILDEDSKATIEIVGKHGNVMDKEMNEVMSEMEKELRGTTLGQSFDRRKDNDVNGTDNNGSSDDEDIQVDIDLNLVNNFLKSISSQEDMTGPVSNLFVTMGIPLPPHDN